MYDMKRISDDTITITNIDPEIQQQYTVSRAYHKVFQMICICVLRYYCIMIPGWVGRHDCIWSIVGYFAEFTHHRRSALEIDSHTITRFVDAFDSTLNHGTYIPNSGDVCVLGDAFHLLKPTC